MKNHILNFLKDLGLFFKGAMDFERKSRGMIENDYNNEIDEFMIICFSDSLGLPLPINYYTLELLPYLADDLDHWITRMGDKKSIWEQKGAELDFDI